jgi:hypothetical protein
MARNDPGGSMRSSGSNGGADHDADARGGLVVQENGRRSVESTPQSGRRVGGVVHSPEELAKIRHSRHTAVIKKYNSFHFAAFILIISA